MLQKIFWLVWLEQFFENFGFLVYCQANKKREQSYSVKSLVTTNNHRIDISY